VSRKQKYLDLFELGNVDKSFFTGRMQEIQADLIKFQAEKSKLELELMDDNASLIVFEKVRELIHGFHQILTVAPFEQRKTLMHLFIKRIKMDTSNKIETIELRFDENVDSYFSDSLVEVAAWDSLSSKHIRKRGEIEFAI
jgi:hypothetical protein